MIDGRLKCLFSPLCFWQQLIATFVQALLSLLRQGLVRSAFKSTLKVYVIDGMQDLSSFILLFTE